MSKKVSLPVMSLFLTGILYIVGLLFVALKLYIVPTFLSGSTETLLDGLFGFLAAFLIIWAITSLVLHPEIDDDNVKMLFIAVGILIVISVFTSLFALTISVGVYYP